MPLDPSVKTLIDNFSAQYTVYRDGAYNETQLRRDFLDGFIAALGWDVNNASGSHETFREVVHEDRISIAGQSKAPDYCVQLGGRKLFYVEAKKPAVNIGADPGPAYQARRYGWNAKMPVCLLSNFAEFAIYDTSVQPSVKDGAAAARIFYCRYDELETVNPLHGITNYEYIHSIFSKEAVLKGSLERIKKDTGKRGTQEVDDVFLAEIENWRVMLANNIALRNGALTERQINFAVQKTIDRVIFLRICEDRGIESRNILQSAAESADVYKHLLNLFMGADEKYNSGLFDFSEDRLTPSLSIDGKVLKDIIRTLYYPAPYEFAVMPADILGSIYERFLGKVIRLTPGHRAKVEEKPEVRKAGGVYYTPAYIVDYIVRHTIGEALKDKSPKTIGAFRILDPACGSGSFLINAYQYLLDWHLEKYLEELTTNLTSKRLVKLGNDSYKLSIQERKRILTAHIFGVDIDEQAVEVTKLSLLLKAVEGLNGQEIQKSLFHERVLPDLVGNIKCGNSLIGSDFYAQGTLGFSEEEQYKINAFEWEVEFCDVFSHKGTKDTKGFDVVVGNPPYVRIHEMAENEKSYFLQHYTAASNQFDLYQLFYEKGLRLLNTGGRIGFITSNKFCVTRYGRKLREFIFDNYNILSITDCSNVPVFKAASTYPYIFIIQNRKTAANKTTVFILELIKNKPVFTLTNTVRQSALLSGPERNVLLTANGNTDVLNKIESAARFDVLDVYRGRGTSKDLSAKKQPGTVLSITNKQIKRFALDKQVFYRNKTLYINDFEPKLLMKKICYTLEICLDETGKINPINTVYVIKSKRPEYSLRFLLGLLCSSLLTYYARTRYLSTHMQGGYIELRVFEIETLPVPLLDFSKKSDKDRHDKLAALVEEMLALKKRESAEVLPQARTVIQRQIAALDNRIDEAVYGLYNLTEEEIKVVEKAK